MAAVLFGASAPAASELAGETSPLVLAGLLYLGAGLAVLPAVVRRPPSHAALVREWRPALGAVVAGGAVGPVLLVAGLARTSAASASILLNLELVATVVLSAVVWREHVGRNLATGAALVTAAGVVLVWEPGAEVSVGALLIALACVAWGVDNGVTSQIDQLSPEHVVLAKGVLAGGANLALGALVVGGGGGAPGVSGVVAALVIGAAGYGVSITLWVKGARDLGAARGQVLFATAPFIGAVVAWVALGEGVRPLQVLAVVLAAGGVGLATRSAHEHDHVHGPLEHDHEHEHDEHHRHDHGAVDVQPGGRHTHRHRHEPLEHAHPHVPELHHRHQH